MGNRRDLKLGNVKAALRAARTAHLLETPIHRQTPPLPDDTTGSGPPPDTNPPVLNDDPAQMRKLLADFCRLLGTRVIKQPAIPLTLSMEASLPPRLRQVLLRLLSGDSEKQIATLLQLSPHTVHAYVKDLYKRYNVSSRGELLAKFIPNPRLK